MGDERVLGNGEHAAVAEQDSVSVLMLRVDALAPGDDFRIDDDPEQLAELATSIATHGVIQPLLVRQLTGGGWEVVAGRRRLAAARAALIENMHRRRLSPIEQGMAFARLRDRGLTQVEIARRVGRSDFTVSVMLQLLEMPAAIRRKVHTGKMSYSTAYDLHKRGKARAEGGSGPRVRGGKLTGDDVALVSHWRRRHDRLLAGIHAVLKARPRDVPEFRMMLDRLLKLDLQPLDGGEGAR